MTTPSPNNAFGTFLLPQSGPAIYFDCVVSEQVVRDAEITEFPVEVGANISDHYRVKLNEIRLEVFVSQEPIDNLRHPSGQGFWGAQKLITPPYPSGPVLATVAKAIVNPVGSIVGVVGGLLDGLDRPVTANPVLQWAAPFDSLQELLTALDAIRTAAGLVDIYTKSAVYTDMAIANVTTNRDKETGSGSKVSLEFRRIAKVSTQQVAAPPVPVHPKDTPPVAKGAQQPQDPGPMTSLASAGLTLLKGAFGGGP
jgi:hypothetical protein